MSGIMDMVGARRVSNHSVFMGCGLLMLIGVLAIGGYLTAFIVRDSRAAQYPGSVPVSSHSNYSGLPFEYRRDNSYRSTDNFTDVYNWYSVTFDTGAEARANGGCIYLEGSDSQLLFNRHINIFLCSTSYGQMIYVTRFTALGDRSAILSRVEDVGRSLFMR